MTGLIENCVGCQKDLLPDEGWKVIGTEGKYKGKNIPICDFQCLLRFDCSNADSGYPGAQAVNIADVVIEKKPQLKRG